MDRLEKILEDCAQWAIEIRRELHRFPELGNQEFRTSRRIIETLNDLGIEVQNIIGTGIVGIIRGSEPPPFLNGKCIAIRADMDALPIHEKTEIPFRSEVDGVMHACGHDAHTAILLGVAMALAELKEKFSGTVKLFFQPAEETDGGADRMVNNGCMENPKVGAVIGLHVDPTLETGRFGLKSGVINANSDMINITVTGKQTHGAYRGQGIDPILMAAEIVKGFIALPNSLGHDEEAVVSFGSCHGGTQRNIIPDTVDLTGILRTLSGEARDTIKEQMVEIVSIIEKKHGGTVRLDFLEGYRMLVNDEKLVNKVAKVMEGQFGKNAVVWHDKARMGVDDFSAFAEEAPGCCFYLGCKAPNRENFPLHSDKFYLDEGCIKKGIEAELYAVLEYLR